MENILLLVDFALPVLMLYWVVKKGSLSIVYVPFIFFAYRAIGKSEIVIIYHLMFGLLLIYYIIYNLPFLLKNYFYLVLILMLTYGIFFLGPLKPIRMSVIGLYWFFTIITLGPQIARRYSKDLMNNELGRSGFYILLFFISNSILATFLNYYPEIGYKFSSGISFGNISISEYGVLPIATFLALRKGVKENNFFIILVVVAGLFFTLLTMRRSVMLFSIIGVLVALIELLTFKQIKKVIGYGVFLLSISFAVLYYTGFMNQFQERFEKRNLEDRPVDEERRVLEYTLIYNDLFVFYDYDPWFGFGPMKSESNYGRGVFGERPLHSDITYFIHGFGIIGFIVYLIMVFTVFLNGYKRMKNREDLSVFIFISFYFLSFLFIGWPKVPMSPILLFMALSSLFCYMYPVPSRINKKILV